MGVFDVAIIGAGITGCSISRELSRYDLSIAVIEAGNDVATGATKGNGGLIHAGYDPTPGTMKARLNARGNSLYPQLSKDLGFKFKRTGSLVLGFDDQDLAHLMKLKEYGALNGTGVLEILRGDDIRRVEPLSSPKATCALWAKDTGIVDPFEVAIATAENAKANGAEFFFNEPVTGISSRSGLFEIDTPGRTISARYIVNAAGGNGAEICDMAGGEHIEMSWRQGNILVFAKDSGVSGIMPIYPVPSATSKGVVVLETIHANVIVGSTAVYRKKDDTSCYAEDIEQLLSGARKLAPSLKTSHLIREFAGTRAVITNTNDFLVERSKKIDHLINAIGIQSPGVASAPAIAEYVCKLLKDAGLRLALRRDFNPIREAPIDFDTLSAVEQDQLVSENPAWGRIVCRCEMVPEQEVINAINAPLGARSVEGVKRRCRAGMGPCQSGFCQSKVITLLSQELGTPITEIPLEQNHSTIIQGAVK